MSTRVVGAVVMCHSDDNGLVLPPKLAPIQVVIVPIWRGSDPKDEIIAAARRIEAQLKEVGVRTKVDDRDNMNPGAKYHDWELAGVPLRIELGPRDLQKETVVCVKRTNRDKSFNPMAELADRIPALLDEIQDEMYQTALRRREEATYNVDSWDEFTAAVEGRGGFLLAHWCGRSECETQIQTETKATIRLLAFDQPEESGRCIRCDGESSRRAHFAKAY
jgi:prolyl-tRNA synthetase